MKVERKGRERGERGKKEEKKGKNILKKCAEECKSKLGRYQRGDEEIVLRDEVSSK